MRKKIQLLFILLLSIFYKSQDNSIAASVLAPIAPQTGVPDISYPLVSLPATKDFTLNFGISYNPNSYRLGEYSGQVARNWMISGSNFIITRKIINTSTDENDIPYNRPFDDIYYYNLNGEQGSFKFEKIGTPSTGLTFKIIKLTPSNIKIDFEREATYSNPVKSFTITDSKGYKYYFLDYDYSNATENIGSNIRNTFYITKIENQIGNEIAAFNNTKYIKYREHSNNTLVDAWTYLPANITTKYGKIYIEHGDSENYFDFQDRYYIKSFVLKDIKENIISAFNLDIVTSSYSYYYWDDYKGFTTKDIYTRVLSRLDRLGKNLNIEERTKFEYSSAYPRKYGPSDIYWKDVFYQAYTNEDPNFLMYGLLKAIYPPSGGKIEYEFGANKLKAFEASSTDYYINKNAPSYIEKMKSPFDFSDPEIQYLEMVKEIDFDSHISKKYPITGLNKSPNSRIYILFQKEEVYDWPGPDGPIDKGGIPMPPPKLSYRVNNAIPDNNSNTHWYNTDIEKQCDECYFIVPNDGTANIEITGSGGWGYLFLYEKLNTEPPFINEKTLSNSGVRIEQIKYYERANNFILNYPQYDLRKTVTFDYSRFDEAGVSSGVAVPDDQKEAIIYKNIKVIESDKPGYTKYYYKTTEDFPTYPHPTITYEKVTPNFNIIKKGLLDKKEIYDSHNNKQQLITFSYTLPTYDATRLYEYDVFCEHCHYGWVDAFKMYTQESFLEKTNSNMITYDVLGNTQTDSSEKTFNQENNNLMKEKKTMADGTVMETEYQYAAEKNNTKLLGANMFSVPLEVTQKQNGIQTGKLETKYNQTGNYFPSSVTSFGINNVITGVQTNEIYDNMGNVLQTRSKSGMTTAIIWGYGGTQPIAKIEGGEYNNILALMGQTDANLLDIVQKSNQDISSTDNTNEQLLRNALETFRKKPEFKNYLITTYTYDPLIGVKSVTSPNGFTEYYFYDNQNRMIRVEDNNHNVIKENKYLQYIQSPYTY
ncbi:hypothetical protein [Epilithonimonas zeae]|uniref:hypothetical protein n=1 Tax=Epilithonimonas zeae TaxID=1416779 RepID=UPI00200D5D57|nr:hypothetical protein [Epilithonimonas zeae]UQB67786.1 hypothetical protein KI430_12180 [Epilithonimonas zeae]